MRPERMPLYNKFGFEGSRTIGSNVQIYILEHSRFGGGVGICDIYSVNIRRLSFWVLDSSVHGLVKETDRLTAIVE